MEVFRIVFLTACKVAALLGCVCVRSWQRNPKNDNETHINIASIQTVFGHFVHVYVCKDACTRKKEASYISVECQSFHVLYLWITEVISLLIRSPKNTLHVIDSPQFNSVHE